MKKVVLLLLAIGFLSFSSSSRFGGYVCTGGTGNDSWAVWYDTDGNYFMTPSQNQQANGHTTQQISGSMANYMCAIK